MPTEVKRATRVSERIREEVASIIGRDLRDPRVQGVVIARVEMPGDLRSAKVYFRMLEGGDDPARRKGALEGLDRASALLRREVTTRVGLRYAPELRFFYDEGQEQRMRIDALLEEVKTERRERGEKE
jgi:ribosome-binding factor A